MPRFTIIVREGHTACKYVVDAPDKRTALARVRQDVKTRKNPIAKTGSRARFKHKRMARPGMFDPRSIRTKAVGRQKQHRVVIGCPKGQWMPKKVWYKGGRKITGKCRVGMRGQAVLHPLRENPLLKGHLRVGDAYKFRMRNWPGQPWAAYWVLRLEPGGSVIFSSIQPSGLQYQAEHFRLSRKDFLNYLRSGDVRRAYGENPAKRCALCRCEAIASAHGFSVCKYHVTHGESDPSCPVCAWPAYGKNPRKFGRTPKPYQPKTGQPCYCRPGQERDNCPACEGTGQRIDFAAIRARPLQSPDKFITYLEETLIPDLKEMGRTKTAEDFEAAIGYIKSPGARGAGKFVVYLNNTLIPDLKEAGMTSTAKDFGTAIRLIQRGRWALGKNPPPKRAWKLFEPCRADEHWECARIRRDPHGNTLSCSCACHRTGGEK